MELISILKIFRNLFTTINGKVQLTLQRKVYLEYWSKKENFGDSLSPVVFKYMLLDKNINESKKTRRKHFTCIGSILGICKCDCVVWGTGALGTQQIINTRKWKTHFDVRAVRGPLTLDAIKQNAFSFNLSENVSFGDPAILMPLIYAKEKNKKFRYGILSYAPGEKIFEDFFIISVLSNDYTKIIDFITQAELIITPSLHGIIVAEAYGVNAILLNEGRLKMFKYDDYYLSTKRSTIFATSVEEALRMKPLPLPNLTTMQQDLLRKFPYDIWKN